MAHHTDMNHITITFEDTFSFAKVVKHTTVSQHTLEQMQKQIGTIVIDRFNKATAIHEQLKLVSIVKG